MYDTANLILGDVDAFLLALRDDGLSYRDISDELLTYKIKATHETVRAWVLRIEAENAAAAS